MPNGATLICRAFENSKQLRQLLSQSGTASDDFIMGVVQLTNLPVSFTIMLGAALLQSHQTTIAAMGRKILEAKLPLVGADLSDFPEETLQMLRLFCSNNRVRSDLTLLLSTFSVKILIACRSSRLQRAQLLLLTRCTQLKDASQAQFRLANPPPR